MLDIPNARHSTYLIETSHSKKHSLTIDLMQRVFKENIFLPMHNIDNVTLSNNENELANVLNIEGAIGNILIAIERKIIKHTFNIDHLIELNDSYHRKNGMLMLCVTIIEGVDYEILYKL
jgi:hypothetical protein